MIDRAEGFGRFNGNNRGNLCEAYGRGLVAMRVIDDAALNRGMAWGVESPQSLRRLTCWGHIRGFFCCRTNILGPSHRKTSIFSGCFNAIRLEIDLLFVLDPQP
jgi:hypothetical protein